MNGKKEKKKKVLFVCESEFHEIKKRDDEDDFSF